MDAVTVILTKAKPAVQKAWVKKLNDNGISAKLCKSGSPGSWATLGVEVSPAVAAAWASANEECKGMTADDAVAHRIAVCKAAV